MHINVFILHDHCNIMKSTQKMQINKLRIDREYFNLVPRPCRGDMDLINADIKKNGIENPIIINQNNIVIDGHTRLDIATGLGHTKVPVEIRKFKNKEAEINFIIQVNILRRHLTSAQKVAIGLKLLKLEKERAKKRQREHGKTAPGKSKTVMDSESTDSGKSRDIVAKQMGISSKTLQQGLKINVLMDSLNKKKSDILKVEWNDLLAGKKSLKSVYKTAIELEGKQPRKNVNYSNFIVKEADKFNNQLSEWKVKKINNIKNEDDKERVVESIKKIYDALSILILRISSDKTININVEK